MNEFLDEADDIQRTGNLTDEAKKDYELVFRALEMLQPSAHKGKINLNNIESVFVAFEMVEFTNKLGNLKVEDIKRLPTAMKVLIQTTLEESIKFLIRKSSPNIIMAPEPYRSFALMLEDLMKYKPKLNISIVSFNYDVCLEFALKNQNIEFDQVLNGKASSARIKLFKLHGSLNWEFCSQCDYIEAGGIENILIDLKKVA